MGNEASLEGGGAEGRLPPGPAAGHPSPLGAAKPPSAPGAGGQLPERAAAPASADSTPRRLAQSDLPVGERSASPSLKQSAQTHESTREMLSHGHASQQADGPRRTLQVDTRIQRSGRSPSVSPDRGSTPTSPYSVPQIAPLPSSTLCPICKTTELTSSPNQPNFNTCTQCHNKVCNQCGFNPNPHLTEQGIMSDITLMRISDSEKERMLRESMQKPGPYAAMLCRAMIPEYLIVSWRGNVSYHGGPNKIALPRNLMTRLEHYLQESYVEISHEDFVSIPGHIDRILV